MKKTYAYLGFIIVSSLFSSISRTDDCGDELDAEIEAILDSGIIELEAPVPVQNNCFPTCTIVDILTPKTTPDQNDPIINAINILKEDIYKKTTGPVTRRSLLDEPGLITDYFTPRCGWGINMDFFFNYSPKVFFTKDSPFINSYIALNNPNVLDEIIKVENLGNIPDALGLFSNIKLYQYRAGLMFSFNRQWENFLITGRIPLYYLLEHFFLTDEERKAIENNPLFETEDGAEGFGPQQDEEAFGLRHLVSDRFGVGDSRLSLLGHAWKSPCNNAWLGLQLTIPTAKSFKRGLLGAEFDPDATIPQFNLQYLFNLSPFSRCNQDQNLANKVLAQQLTNFFVSALDRLSTILINTPLGNGKHWGIGPEFNYRHTFNEYFSCHTYATVEAYMPHHEKRFFLVAKQPSDFNRDWRDHTMCGENLAIINRLIVTTLFPVAVKTSVFPGVRFQVNQAFMYTSKHWDLRAGFDFWAQGREKLGMLVTDLPVDLPFVECKALRPAAYQGKLFFNAGYFDRLCDNTFDWRIQFCFDGTIFHRGIGKNYTGSLRLGVDF